MFLLKRADAVLAKEDEYAPGIPRDKTIKRVPLVGHDSPETWHISTQKHVADRAREHLDLRLVDPVGDAHSWAIPSASLPEPGQRVLAVKQPTHTKEYAARRGRFVIPEGYGKGIVESSGLIPAEVVRSEPGHVRFNVYTGAGPQEYNLIETPKGAILHNITSTAESGVRGSGGQSIPNAKPDYREVSTNLVKFDDPNEIHQAKLDGAHVTFHLLPSRHMKVFSYRPAERATGVIEHTHKLDAYRTLKAPDELAGTVLRGELYARKSDGQALPAETTGGLLNASVWTSRQKQKDLGAKLDNVVFDIVRFKGKTVESEPYAKKLEMIREVVDKVPFLNLPPLAETPEDKVKLFGEIQSGKHPLTSEGIVIWKKDDSRPTKAKFRPDVDAEVVGVTKGKGKFTESIGALQVRLPGRDTVTNVGTGLSEGLRREIAKNPDSYIGRYAKVRTQQVFPSGRLRAPSFAGFHIEKGASVPIKVHAYVIGPAGAGKTTYVKKHYPAAKFHIIHSDKYAEPSKKQPGKVKINWDRAIADAKKAGKPVVVDAMHPHEPLMRAAKDKILLDPGRVTVLAQLIARRSKSSKKEGHLLSPEQKLDSFDKKVRPLAQRLGFRKVGHVCGNSQNIRV